MKCDCPDAQEDFLAAAEHGAKACGRLSWFLMSVLGVRLERALERNAMRFSIISFPKTLASFRRLYGQSPSRLNSETS